ncbi:MAG: hypothetical protein KBA46_04055, partial [Candidatus Omnitrophica bacterium]|nr:hypothetical protein [Candidatus Omnitrophota bacterium]
IGTILDTISRNPDSVLANMGKDHYIEYQVQSAVQEADGFDLLTMGRPEGPGCYCYVNNALRAVMQKLIKNYDYIVIDNEAGLEHLSRRTTRAADALVVVSDVTKVGLRAAQRINDLAHELDIKIRKRFLIVNQCVGECDARKFSLDGLECLGALPQDQEINARSINGDSLLMISDSSVSLRALRLIGETIWQR